MDEKLKEKIPDIGIDREIIIEAVSVEEGLAWRMSALIAAGEGQHDQSSSPPSDPSGRTCHSP